MNFINGGVFGFRVSVYPVFDGAARRNFKEAHAAWITHRSF
jgi:hypothetical protein